MTMYSLKQIAWTPSGEQPLNKPLPVKENRTLGAACMALIAIVAGAPAVADTYVQTLTASHRGQVRSLSMEEGLLFAEDTGEVIRVGTDALVTVDFDRPRDPFQGRRLQINLVKGDRVLGNLVQGDDEKIAVDSPGLGRIRIPLERVRTIQTAAARDGAHREAASWFIRRSSNEEDAVLLTNGDIVRGFITGIETDGISIEAALGESRIDFRLVVAARIAVGDNQLPKGPLFVVSSVDGSRLTCTGFSYGDGKVKAETWFGPDASIPADRLRRIEVIGGRWEYLTGHDPVSYEQVPMLSVPWPWLTDRNVLGLPLRVAGQDYERGIGVHSRAVLVYDLGAGYSEFVTSAGVDDMSGPWADVSVAILLDGKPVFERTAVGRGELIGPLRFDVSRAGTLTLRCDYGRNGDLQDRFNWIAPALIRKPTP